MTPDSIEESRKDCIIHATSCHLCEIVDFSFHGIIPSVRCEKGYLLHTVWGQKLQIRDMELELERAQREIAASDYWRAWGVAG